MLRMNTKSKFIVENWHFKGEGRLRELSEFQEVLLVSLREIESRTSYLQVNACSLFGNAPIIEGTPCQSHCGFLFSYFY